MSRDDRPPLRLWPAALILAGTAATLVAVWLPADSPVAMSQTTATLFTLLGAALFLLLWWLLFSRAPLWARLAACVALVVGGWVGSRFTELRGVSGDLVPRLAWRGRATPAPLPAAPIVTPAPPASLLRTSPEPPPPREVMGDGTVGTRSASTSDRDFPQFLGPRRDATVLGVHLSTGWGARAPVTMWRHSIGTGWAGFAVSGGLAVTQEQRDGRSFVVAYDLRTGTPRWSAEGGGGFHSTVGNGPRATPAIQEGRVYAFGVDGVLRVLELATGQPVFERDVLGENDGRAPMHGVSASPLVTDGLVAVVAGGTSARSLVAYDARTGEPRWAGGDQGAAYSSPLLTTLAGRRQIVVFGERGLAGHDVETGEVLWTDRWPDRPEKVAQPVAVGDDRLFASMGYGVGGRLVRISRDEDGSFSSRVTWETRRLKAKFTQVVEREGFLYGLDEGVLVCLDLRDGERRWKDGRYGHGQVLLVDDVLLVQTEDGEIVLVDPTPDGLVELDRFEALEGKTWATPALAGDLLVVRSEIEAACYRLPTEAGTAASPDRRLQVAGGL